MQERAEAAGARRVQEEAAAAAARRERYPGAGLQSAVQKNWQQENKENTAAPLSHKKSGT